MMQGIFQKYIKTVLYYSIGTCVAMILLNYLVDPFNVFHTKAAVYKTYFEPNTRFIKTRFLAENCNQFDAYIFGTSRSVVYRTSDINSQFKVKAYNYAVSDDTPLGALQKLKWLVSNACAVKKIFLPISIDRVKIIDYAAQQKLLLRMEHPFISDKPFSDSAPNFLMSLDATRLSIRTVLMSLMGRKSNFEYDFSTGNVTYFWDEAVAKGCGAKAKGISDNVLSDYAAIISDIRKFTKKNHIDMVLFWNPQPAAVQLSYSLETYKKLLSILAQSNSHIYRIQVGDERLSDDNFYHDSSHFKASLAKQLIIPENRVPIEQILEEIKQAIHKCSV